MRNHERLILWGWCGVLVLIFVLFLKKAFSS